MRITTSMRLVCSIWHMPGPHRDNLSQNTGVVKGRGTMCGGRARRVFIKPTGEGVHPSLKCSLKNIKKNFFFCECVSGCMYICRMPHVYMPDEVRRGHHRSPGTGGI